MSKNSFRVLFIIAFLQTGVSDSSVHIRQKKEGDRLNVTCALSGIENLTQVNWEMVQGTNRTMLGIFHPQFGYYIQPENNGKIKLEGKQYPQACSSISLEMVSLNMSEEICCVFMTFPSGHLNQCCKISDSEEVINTDTTKTEAQAAGHRMGLLRQFGVLIIGSILSLIFLVILVSLFYKCCSRREQVFNVQQANLTEATTSAETNTEETHEVQPAAPGFDPAKLYAKIKEDLYYGRLWKSYQGRARFPVQGSPAASRQIYFRLGEKPLPQRKKEDEPKVSDTTTPSQLQSK